MMNSVRVFFLFIDCKKYLHKIDSASQRTLNDTNRPETQDSQMSIASSRSTLQR